ncbi:hypothetical protein IH779_00250 [Patescibacteria group bacterium]|nr:hypothetical protein [Patescibacteria group bacterium]
MQGRIKVLVAVLGLAAVLLVAGGVALATSHIPDQNGVINACYKNQSEQLSVVDVNGNCANNETKISWNQTGPQGPIGLTGPAGPQGNPGSPGVSNLQRVSNQATISTNSFLLVSAICTDGRVVLGGGASASNSNINVWINQPGIGINDAGGSGGWTGAAGHVGGSPGFTLRVYAICANVAP